jgi:hypothetical protein
MWHATSTSHDHKLYDQIKIILGIDSDFIIFASYHCWVHAQMGGPIWLSHKPILPCGCHCNAHVIL